jgi:hypothetical protein
MYSRLKIKTYKVKLSTNSPIVIEKVYAYRSNENFYYKCPICKTIKKVSKVKLEQMLRGGGFRASCFCNRSKNLLVIYTDGDGKSIRIINDINIEGVYIRFNSSLPIPFEIEVKRKFGDTTMSIIEAKKLADFIYLNINTI